MFGTLSAWFDRLSAFHALSSAERRDTHAFEKAFEDTVERAREALDRGDTEVSLAIWRETHRMPPGLARNAKTAMRLLLDLGQFDEAEAIVREGRRRRPSDPRFAIDAARIAHRRGDDAEETLRRCDTLRRKFPRAAEGYTIAAICLTSLGRDAEAGSLLRRAARKLPKDLEILGEYARHAESARDWAEALRRWEAGNARFDHLLCRGGIAHCLRELGKYEEATAFASETTRRFPRDPWAFAELAHVAAAADQPDEACRLWAEARRHFPFFLPAYADAAALAARNGREAEADSILGLAVNRFRWNLDLHLAYARQAAGDDDRAARWTLVSERFPDCQEAAEAMCR